MADGQTRCRNCNALVEKSSTLGSTSRGIRISDTNMEPSHSAQGSGNSSDTKENSKDNNPAKDIVVKTIDGLVVRTLFIANLPLLATELDIFHTFKRFGVIVSTSIAHNPKSHKKSTFGFVTYSCPQFAARALKCKKNIKIRSQRLYVSVADSWHQPVENPDGSVIWDRRRHRNEPVDLEDSSSGSEEDVLVQDNESCPIFKLNDDCLRMIFSYIPLYDWLALGIVCRRWRDITSLMWSGVKSLDFTKPPLCNVTLSARLLGVLAKKCSNVTSINVCKLSHHLPPSTLAIIATKCRLLEDLSFNLINIQNRSFALLARSCPNLRNIYIEACSNCHDGELISLVTKSTKLESITIKYNTYELSVGIWLKHLKEPLRSLCLHMYDFNPEFLLQGIKNVKNSLKELSFTSCSTVRCSDLDIITKTVPDLMSLELTGLHPDFKAHTLSHISKLKNLTHLNLEHNPVVCDGFIRDLLENCPRIKAINLSGAESHLLTHTGLCLVAKFPDLTHLTLAYLDKLADETLNTIAHRASNLTHLILVGCLSITDEGCSSVVSLCRSLKKLDVSGCKFVTQATVMSAVEAARMGVRKNVLTMVIGGTGVDLEYDWESPHVIIDRGSNFNHGHFTLHDGDFFLLGDEVFYPDLYPNPLDLVNLVDFNDLLSCYDDLDDDEDFDPDVASVDSFEVF